MKYLINIYAHDGIVSHYTGVGSIVRRYIRAFESIAHDSSHSNEIMINLITPEYNENSFGFSHIYKQMNQESIEKLGGKIYQVSNGTNGAVNYGVVAQWETLCKNSASIARLLNSEEYDARLDIFNDTPFAQLACYFDEPDERTARVWVPHSTILLHGGDSALKDKQAHYANERYIWESTAITYINEHPRCFVGSIGKDFSKHLVRDYGLLECKTIALINGVLPTSDDTQVYNEECRKLLTKIDKHKPILISYARAEPYKNLEYTMKIGEQLKDQMQTIVIAQSYFPEQPILEEYRRLARQTGTYLFVDPPFSFPQYLLTMCSQPKVLLVPSHREAMGLIINEVRSRNDPSILVVANNVDGLNEQINDGYDGILIDAAGDVTQAVKKISEYCSPERMERLCAQSRTTLVSKYDLMKNVDDFLRNATKHLQKGYENAERN